MLRVAISTDKFWGKVVAGLFLIGFLYKILKKPKKDPQRSDIQNNRLSNNSYSYETWESQNVCRTFTVYNSKYHNITCKLLC